MKLRVRNLTDVNDIIISSGKQKILVKKDEEKGIKAEIESGVEYEIIENQKQMNFIHKLLLWIVFVFMELVGEETEVYISDALSFNMKMRNAYKSILVAKPSGQAIETILTDYQMRACLDVIKFDRGRNNSTATIRYEHNFNKEEIRSKFRSWLYESLLICAIWESFFVCISVVLFFLKNDVFVIAACAVILLAMGMLTRFVALVFRSYEMFQQLMGKDILTGESDCYNENTKTIYLKNTTSNNLIAALCDDRLQERQIVLFSGSTKRVRLAQNTKGINIKSIEQGANLSGRKILYRSFYCLVNYVLFNFHVKSVMTFGNYIHKLREHKQFIPLTQTEEIEIKYVEGEKKNRFWQIGKHPDKKGENDIQQEELAALYKQWREEVIGAVLAYSCVMAVLMAISIFVLGKVGILIVAIPIVIKLIQFVFVITEQ